MTRKEKLKCIAEAVCNYYTVSLDSILSNNRKGEVVKAKHMIVYIIKSSLTINFTEIGTFLGKDPSALSKAYYRIENDLRLDKFLREELKELQEYLCLECE